MNAQTRVLARTPAAEESAPAGPVWASALLARPVVVGVVGFVLTRVLTLAVALAAGRSLLWTEGVGPDDTGMIGKGDGGWYMSIASGGYDGLITGDNAAGLSNLAHFPLYPALIRALGLAGFGMTNLGMQLSAVVISAVASVIAAWGLVRFGQELGSATGGILLAVLWGVQPASVALSMALTESLFTALAVWCLVLLMRRQLMAAAWVCLLAGLTRPTGIALVLAVAWAALMAVRAGGGRGRSLAAILVAPSGLIAYIAYVAVRTGEWDGYLQVQRRWGSTIDWGRSLVEAIAAVDDFARVPIGLSVVLVGVAAVLLVLLAAMRVPGVVLVYTTTCLALILLQSNYVASRERFLLVVFPLLWPIAMWLRRQSAPVVTGVLAGAALLSALYGSYLLFTWPYSV